MKQYKVLLTLALSESHGRTFLKCEPHRVWSTCGDKTFNMQLEVACLSFCFTKAGSDDQLQRQEEWIPPIEYLNCLLQTSCQPVEET